MKTKKVYVVAASDKSEFVDACRDGVKMNDLRYSIRIIPLVADDSKEAAIRDCRRWNRESHHLNVHFYFELNVYSI